MSTLNENNENFQKGRMFPADSIIILSLISSVVVMKGYLYNELILSWHVWNFFCRVVWFTMNKNIMEKRLFNFVWIAFLLASLWIYPVSSEDGKLHFHLFVTTVYLIREFSVKSLFKLPITFSTHQILIVLLDLVFIFCVTSKLWDSLIKNFLQS